MFSDSEIIRSLVLSTINTRTRNRSTSRGRRSYSTQSRPIAPASHHRDIESGLSALQHKSKLYTETEFDNPETFQLSKRRATSENTRCKTLQIVELGHSPRKYSAVRNIGEPPGSTVREGKQRVFLVSLILNAST